MTAAKKGALLKLSGLLEQLDHYAPFSLNESWDNSRLITGYLNETVTGVVVAVNLGPEAISKAQKSKSNTIICHHPPIFKSISAVTEQNQPYLLQAMRLGLNVVCLHSNFDLSSEFLNKSIAQSLGLTYAGPLSRPINVHTKSGLSKVIVHLPASDVDHMRNSLSSRAGAGVIGDYEQCAFVLEGLGSFKGTAKSNPVLGKRGQLECVAEAQLQMVFPTERQRDVENVIYAEHPYEEPAFDIIHLAPPLVQKKAASHRGYGFVSLPTSISKESLQVKIKNHFNISNFIYIKSLNEQQKYQRVAFSPGSGSGFIKDAIQHKVDAYITGEVSYHNQLEARRSGVSLYLIGHSYSERGFVLTVTSWMKEQKIPVHSVFETIESIV